MDFNYMSELLGNECWPEETVNRSDSLNQFPSDSSNALSLSDTFPFENIFFQTQESNHGHCVRSYHPGDTSLDESQAQARVSTEEGLVSFAGCSGQPSYLVDGMESSMSSWIAPRAAAGPISSVTDRLVRAIRSIKDSTKDQDVLIQIWCPRVLNGMRVLTTIDQPYIVDPSSTSLANYRSISLNFQFSADNNSEMFKGMPGRVFLGKVPEWTPDVRFFRIEDYARVGYAQTLNVRGALALPVFDQGSQTCLCVFEVMTTTLAIKAELDSACEALQAVDLRSTGSQTTGKAKACKQPYQSALPDILEVMKSACMSHNLPLAQTWMRCVQQGGGSCRHSKESYINYISTVDSACYVFDPCVRGFHEACSEHHLLQGQGVVGKAFTTNDPCFYNDIASFRKTDYPLSDHARMFGLHAAVAIRFRSVHTGVTDFVLEFFLPADCLELEEQKNMLSSLSVTIQQTCRGLRVVTDDELKEDDMTSITASVASLNYGAEETKMFYEQSRLVATTSIQKEESTKSSKAENTITLEVLQRHFAGSLNDAARSLGVCPTTLKRICRKQGIQRWPFRKIQRVGNSLEKLHSVIDSVQGPSSTYRIGSFYSLFPELASPSSKSLSVHHEVNDVSHLSVSRQSSSSSQSYSSGSHRRTSSWNSTKSEETATVSVKENENYAELKNTHLNVMACEDPKSLQRSQSNVIRGRNPNIETLTPFRKNTEKESEGMRVKVTYGEDTIRMRMQNNWQFKDLQEEIAGRFNVDASSEMRLKYLDDDSEWVLLTCDADWEECVDVYMSSSSNTIKLSIYASPPPHHGASSLVGRPP